MFQNFIVKIIATTYEIVNLYIKDFVCKYIKKAIYTKLLLRYECDVDPVLGVRKNIQHRYKHPYHDKCKA